MAAVPAYELALAPADLKWLRRHVGTNRCFPAHLHVEGAGRWPVWIGYRGRYSREFPKPSYDVWFGADRPFAGHARLHLNAAYRDPSLLRSRLALQVFADLGVPTPQAWHVWLSVNGQALGLYTCIEALDAAWLQRRGLPDGAIYYGVGGDGTFGLIDQVSGKPKKHLAMGYEKCHPGNDDFSDLVALIWQVCLPPDREFAAEIDRVMDAEAYLRWLAGIVFMSHTDGLVHNYALFRPRGARWQISPWDCDGTWGRVPGGSRLPPDDMPLYGDGENYLSLRLLTAPRWRSRYLELWEQLLDGPLAAARVAARLGAIAAEIRADARRDPYAGRQFPREPAQIHRWVVDRTRFIRRELAAWQADPAQPFAALRARA